MAKQQEQEHEEKVLLLNRRVRHDLPLTAAEHAAWRRWIMADPAASSSSSAGKRRKRKKRKKRKLTETSSSRAVRTWKPGRSTTRPVPSCPCSVSKCCLRRPPRDAWPHRGCLFMRQSWWLFGRISHSFLCRAATCSVFGLLGSPGLLDFLGGCFRDAARTQRLLARQWIHALRQSTELHVAGREVRTWICLFLPPLVSGSHLVVLFRLKSTGLRILLRDDFQIFPYSAALGSTVFTCLCQSTEVWWISRSSCVKVDSDLEVRGVSGRMSHISYVKVISDRDVDSCPALQCGVSFALAGVFNARS